MKKSPTSPRWLVLAWALAGCPRRDPPPAQPLDAGSDAGGHRFRFIAEVPPEGPSPDRREIDLAVDWIFLVADPMPTGTAPYAFVHALVPCGYEPYFSASTRSEPDVNVRVRARWAGPGEPPLHPAVCPRGTTQLVSLGVLRTGDWTVRDRSAPDGSASAVPRVQHVLPDVGMAPKPERMTRACDTTADCVAGGVCVALGPARTCVAEDDPWLSRREPCIAGMIPTEVTLAGRAPWRVCMVACGDAGACPGRLQCGAQGVCLPPVAVGGATHGAAIPR